MKKIPFPNGAFLIQGFLGQKECRDHIEVAESLHFSEAKIISDGVEVSAPEIRNNDRVIIVDTSLALDWWSRCGQYLRGSIETHEPVGLNERFRFYRYRESQLFRMHRDQPYERAGETSRLSFIVYLNSEFEGGETDFRDFKVTPVTGAALVFPHRLLHEGTVVSKGVKYAVRTDVMFSGGSR